MSLGSTQKGKAVESLVAATCIIGSDGKLSVSIPMVDDEGIDLVFTSKENRKSLFIQVKSRFTLSKKGNYRTQIRKKSFIPQKDFFIMCIFYNRQQAKLGDLLWLIPSIDFKAKLIGQHNKRIYVFQSRLTSQRDMWKPYQVQIKDLPDRILNILREA